VLWRDIEVLKGLGLPAGVADAPPAVMGGLPVLAEVPLDPSWPISVCEIGTRRQTPLSTRHREALEIFRRHNGIK